MENKRNNLLLVSSVLGALFFIGVVTLWVYAFVLANGVGIVTKFRNFVTSFKENGLFWQWMKILVIVLAPISLIFNLISWVKSNNKLTLISGVLYILCLNIFSAPLCFIEYFGVKYKIKNKLLLYTLICSLIFCVIFILLISLTPEDTYFRIYVTITTGIGIILNLIAWKTGIKKLKIIAGVLYVLGIFTIIPAIICFVDSKRVVQPDYSGNT
jgi:hypothetical protein